MPLDLEERVAFGLRLKLARTFKGIGRKEDFGVALAREYPEWAKPSNAKRVEDGTMKNFTQEDLRAWAEKVAAFTGVPLWFMLYGFDPPETVEVPGSDLRELRKAVERHTRMLAKLAEEPARESVTSLELVADEADLKREQEREQPDEQAPGPRG